MLVPFDVNYSFNLKYDVNLVNLFYVKSSARPKKFN